ncbi:hypothetical protein BKA62DRAFT_715103 [Auriculariales sp. MPI-PUGE-AT-0066]|nr:hypothetical protein BKA62DRAFT_715103 [Auriculariales sp. MPI-PUGE-AT-0066]
MQDPELVSYSLHLKRSIAILEAVVGRRAMSRESRTSSASTSSHSTRSTGAEQGNKTKIKSRWSPKAWSSVSRLLDKKPPQANEHNAAPPSSQLTTVSFVRRQVALDGQVDERHAISGRNSAPENHSDHIDNTDFASNPEQPKMARIYTAALSVRTFALQVYVVARFPFQLILWAYPKVVIAFKHPTELYGSRHEARARGVPALGRAREEIWRTAAILFFIFLIGTVALMYLIVVYVAMLVVQQLHGLLGRDHF